MRHGNSHLTHMLLCLLLGFVCIPVASARSSVTVKLATLVPDGSIWHKGLKEMGQQWSQSTEGTVSLRIYAGGVAGDGNRICFISRELFPYFLFLYERI